MPLSRFFWWPIVAKEDKKIIMNCVYINDFSISFTMFVTLCMCVCALVCLLLSAPSPSLFAVEHLKLGVGGVQFVRNLLKSTGGVCLARDRGSRKQTTISRRALHLPSFRYGCLPPPGTQDPSVKNVSIKSGRRPYSREIPWPHSRTSRKRSPETKIPFLCIGTANFRIARKVAGCFMEKCLREQLLEASIINPTNGKKPKVKMAQTWRLRQERKTVKNTGR